MALALLTAMLTARLAANKSPGERVEVGGMAGGFLDKGKISATSNWGWGVMFFFDDDDDDDDDDSWRRRKLCLFVVVALHTCFFRYSRSAAISACGSNFQWEQALQLFVQMADSPDVVSVNASISAFEKAGYILLTQPMANL